MDIDSSDTDLIAAFGYLCLGSRLKRLGERMQGSVAQVLASLGHGVQPAQLPLLMALRGAGAMTIGRLGERVGISQPGVSRTMAVLEIAGLVCTSAPVHGDKRQRRVALTDAGEALMTTLEASLYPAVERAVTNLCAEAGPDLLAMLAGIEAGMTREPLERRILREREAGHGV